MRNSKYVVGSLSLAAFQICLSLPALSAESQASSQAGSQASVGAESAATVQAGSAATTSNATQSSVSGASQAQTNAASESKSFTPLVADKRQPLQSVVNEVSKPQTARRSAVTTKTHAHWKTRVWNQGSTKKTK